MLAVRLGINRMHKWAGLFGFGSPTGLDWPGEKGGLNPSRKSVRHEKRSWSFADTGRLGIGQSKLLVTPLQSAVLLAAEVKRKREALEERVKALIDDPSADLEKGLATLLEGEPAVVGRRWFLAGKGSVTHQQTRVVKGETISDDHYQLLSQRVRAFFTLVEAE